MTARQLCNVLLTSQHSMSIDSDEVDKRTTDIRHWPALHPFKLRDYLRTLLSIVIKREIPEEIGVQKDEIV